MNHFYKNIQGWASFLPWYREMVQRASRNDPSVFVELGCWKGRSAAFMAVEIANARKPIKFYTIDNFRGSDEPAHRADPAIKKGTLFDVARHNLFPVLDKVRVVKEDTVRAADCFGDESVDFLFVDAGHTFDAVTADLNAWYPKMRKKGVIAGDDFTWQGVNLAVKLFCANHEYKYRTEFGSKGTKCWRIDPL